IRQLLFDAVTAAVAVGAAVAPTLVQRAGATDRRIAIGVAITIPILGIMTIFKQWPELRSELLDESNLGFVERADVVTTAHPFLRLGRAGWLDRHAHREFVRIANRIALRKRQQRTRSGEMARLYQLEIIKLRMQMQEMSKIDR